MRRQAFLAFFLCMTVTACASPMRDDKSAASLSAAQAGSRAPLAAHAARVLCDGTCESVQYFDGSAMRLARRDGDGWALPVLHALKHTFVVAVSAAGEAAVRWIGSDARVVRVTFSASRANKDPRKGLLVGVVFESMPGAGSLALLPRRGMSVALFRGRARQALSTDADGVFRASLPAGRYRLAAAGMTWSVDVAAGQVVVVPMEIRRAILN